MKKNFIEKCEELFRRYKVAEGLQSISIEKEGSGWGLYVNGFSISWGDYEDIMDELEEFKEDESMAIYRLKEAIETCVNCGSI